MHVRIPLRPDKLERPISAELHSRSRAGPDSPGRVPVCEMMPPPASPSSFTFQQGWATQSELIRACSSPIGR